jgi:hypothetical protein
MAAVSAQQELKVSYQLDDVDNYERTYFLVLSTCTWCWYLLRFD